MQIPKVSVIIPNYNYGHFLDKRIRSILDQTFQDFEVVYLDDCSTDNSEEVFSRFSNHPKIRAFHNVRNSGSAFKQSIKGVQLSQGEYVWIAQADDYADKDFLETLVPLLDRNPSVGLAYCESWAVDEDEKTLHSMVNLTQVLDDTRWEKDFINNGRDECRRFLIYKNTIPNLSGVLFRRKVFEEAVDVKENFSHSFDYRIWADMLMVSDLAFVARPLNYFRYHADSIRGKSKKAGLQYLEGYHIRAHISDKLGLSDKEMEPVYAYVLHSWLKKVFRRRGRIPLSTATRIYRVAREIDPRLNRRIAQEFLRACPFGVMKDRRAHP